MSVTALQIFNQSMDLMDKRSATGSIDVTKTNRYKVRTPNILTMWQNELATELMIEIPDAIIDLSQVITVTDTISGHYYLASVLLLTEDSDTASYFQQKFEENRRLYMSRRPTKISRIVDVYQSYKYNVEYNNYQGTEEEFNAL